VLTPFVAEGKPTITIFIQPYNRKRLQCVHISPARLRAAMSIKAVKWALVVKNIDATNKLALIAIAESHNDKTGDCYPSQKYIGEIIGLTERPTRARLNKLEADGFFTRKPRYDTRGKRTSDGYVLHFEVTEPNTGRQASASDDDGWGLPAEATAASEEPRLPAVAATGSESQPENRLPAVSDVLPADTAAGTNLLYRKSSTGRDTFGNDIYSEEVSYCDSREPRTKTLEAAHGRWRWILTSFGIPQSALNGKEQPCPACGGRDRFVFDDRHGDGDYFCRRCDAGKGISLVAKVNGWSYAEAAKRVDELIGNQPRPMSAASQRIAERNGSRQPSFPRG
jgi:Zinc-binding domain of primase-helicase